VLEHLLAAPRVRGAVVLTDGYVGTPPPELAAEVRARGLRLHVVLPRTPDGGGTSNRCRLRHPAATAPRERGPVEALT